MEGFGKYKLPTDTQYEGSMKDGMFHGHGTLYFPEGNKYVAEWDKGKPYNGKFIFADGLEFNDTTWDYCNRFDRRFYTEICNGIKPAGTLF
ncbi:unnamed protein product [Protopolystoma xenopodis]|uniref:MORN repeat-containing protein 5 n=1 Tax=Protopolystoma xenopodis TaxID=117903 RepID=A0A448WMJ0_9PLAT|nr:unnamed protein product [Protopolystoma xenopodis]